ncbi:MAG: DUF433 domain-containing protein [Chloroflexota bacterium]
MTEARTVTVPLREEEDGTLRVGSTCVPLDTVVAVFKQGRTPAEICGDFPTLELADVYVVIAYYLQHQAALDAYLGQRAQEATQFQCELEARSTPEGLRGRLHSHQPASAAHPL